jgi:hypothetical protein
MSAELLAALSDLLQRVLRELKRMSASDLRALPEYSDREEQHGNHKLMAAIWKKQLAGGDVQIVVQAYRTKGFGSAMDADGFVVRADGTLDRISEDVRLEYR